MFYCPEASKIRQERNSGDTCSYYSLIRLHRYCQDEDKFYPFYSSDMLVFCFTCNTTNIRPELEQAHAKDWAWTDP